MAHLSYLEHPQVQTLAVPSALQHPLTRMRMPLSTVTNPTATPQLTELIRRPSMTPVPKMPLTSTSKTTFPIMVSP